MTKTKTASPLKKKVESPRSAKRPKGADGDKPKAKKSKVDDGSTSELAESVTSPSVTLGSDVSAMKLDFSEEKRTSEEERAALEKTVDLLIGKGAEIPEDGTPVDRPPELGLVPEELDSSWKAEQDLLRKKEEEERAERRRVRERREREGGREGGKEKLGLDQLWREEERREKWYDRGRLFQW